MNDKVLKEMIYVYLINECECKWIITTEEINRDDWYFEWYIYHSHFRNKLWKLIEFTSEWFETFPDIYSCYLDAKEQVEVVEDLFNTYDMYEVRIYESTNLVCIKNYFTQHWRVMTKDTTIKVRTIEIDILSYQYKKFKNELSD